MKERTKELLGRVSERATSTSGKLVFANQLRGLCAASVVVVHLTVVMLAMRRDVAWVIAAPPLGFTSPSIISFFYPAWLDLGKFGVGAFFLISGFVIPFSLRDATAGNFLIARALRIYPTFWLALLVEGATIAASGAYWHIAPAFGLRDYVVNGLLLQTLLHTPSVDWVSWTLSVEIKFYLLAALLRPLLLSYQVWPLLGTALAALLLNASSRAWPVFLDKQLATEAMFIGYIMIGTLFHYRYQGAISDGRMLACVVALAAVFYISYSLGPTRADAMSLHTASYGLALVVFAAGYWQRARVRPNRVLDGLAAISYPLYLVHSAFGFTVISFLIMAWHLPYAGAAVLAALLSIVVAWGLHSAIELPTIRMGHRLRGRTPRVPALI